MKNQWRQKRQESTAKATTSLGLSRKFYIWVASLVATALGAFVIPNLTDTFKSAYEPAANSIEQLICRASSKQAFVSDTKFQILVAQLNGDSNEFHRGRVVSALNNDYFNVRSICERFVLNPNLGTEKSMMEIKTKGLEAIKKYGADLIVFGNVIKADDSFELWAINSTGGCQSAPTYIVLSHGFIPKDGELSKSIPRDIITQIVAELSAACDHTDSTDWAHFEKQVAKVRLFLDNPPFTLSDDQEESIAGAYSDAMGLIYKYKDEAAYKAATLFNQGRINSKYKNNPIKLAMWKSAQAALEFDRWKKSKKPEAKYAALQLIEEALKSKKLPYTFSLRAEIHEDSGEPILAISDLKAALSILSEPDVDLQKRISELEAKISSQKN